jgi:hypothetical protein
MFVTACRPWGNRGLRREGKLGKLLLFEADVGMIVHSLHPDDLCPYKKPLMAKLFRAFVATLTDRAA